MYLSTAETCERLRLSRWTVSKLVRSGELEAVKGPARNSPLRITKASIDAYVERYTVVPSTPLVEEVA
jgi:excisionase family DNA binding protein